MKALSLTQPWASLVALGAKRVETRSWPTSYRGPLAIHAAAGLGPVGGKRGLRDLVGEQPFRKVLLGTVSGYVPPWEIADVLPLGAILAVCELTDCRSTGRDMYGPAWLEGLSEQELAFGDFTYGRYGWTLDNICALPEPIPCRGALGLWAPPADVLARLQEVTA